MSTANLEDARVELNKRCDAIEECYEFMLAYAGQGLAGEESGGKGTQIREFLTRCDQALSGLAEFLGGFVKKLGIEDKPYGAFMAVIDRDARDSQAAVQLVLAQPSISSQLVDNLNASIHIRAVLTDLFLIDEVFKTYRRS
ncbi:MAG: hypothetical protein ABL961_16285 [Vicinamibacterales bacterium]